MMYVDVVYATPTQSTSSQPPHTTQKKPVVYSNPNHSSSLTMKFAILLSTLTAITGFAPSQPGRSQTTSLYMSDERKTGTVKWFDTAKGFGFIVPDSGEKDVFVHQTNINVSGFRSLAEGESVEFKIVTENGKSKAVDVTGPDGSDVKGAPFKPQSDEYEW